MSTIDTAEGIAAIRLLSLIHALNLEIKTGLKVSPFPLTKVAQQYGATSKTKKGCLDHLIKRYEELTGRTPNLR